MIDDFQILLLLSNQSGTISTRKDRCCYIKGRPIICGEQYELNTHKKNKILQLTKKNIKQEHYDGYVYCVELEKNNTLYVRRNGKAVWSGNSHTTGEVAIELGRYYIGCDIGDRAFEIGKERLGKL